jgi:hypothetical protein
LESKGWNVVQWFKWCSGWWFGTLIFIFPNILGICWE